MNIQVKNNQNLVHYLSCHAVRRTAYLFNFLLLAVCRVFFRIWNMGCQPTLGGPFASLLLSRSLSPPSLPLSPSFPPPLP